MSFPSIELSSPCPCGAKENGSTTAYGQCCGQYHQGLRVAATAEQLMRSRYSAFVLGQFDYLLRTHHVDYRGALTAEQLAQGPHPEWLSLQIISTWQQQDSARVHFQAWYRQQGAVDAIDEDSAFIRENGQWFYTEGKQQQAKLPKRNDLCCCGSGKKFKHCCLR